MLMGMQFRATQPAANKWMFNVTVCYKSVSRDGKLSSISKTDNMQADVRVHELSELNGNERIFKNGMKNLFRAKLLRWRK